MKDQENDFFAGAKVLVVEDDPQAIGVLEPILISKGFSVAVARDGEEGLARIHSDPPDILLLDIDIPRIDGHEVCRRVKSRDETRLIPVVMITGLTEMEDRLRALEAGADEFLNKPFNSAELLTRIKSLLRAKYFNEQLDCAEDVLFAMARAIEAKDSYTQGHVERVSGLAARFGEFVSLSEEEIDALRKGGILHDIGKIGVPDGILNKPGPLTIEERMVVQMHPAQGAKICEKLRSIKQAIPVIRHHHERLDGSGYPDHLTGDEIPFLARIMTIIDIFDALTTNRSYRKALPPEMALTVLHEEANQGWWDKEILAAFAAMARSN